MKVFLPLFAAIAVCTAGVIEDPTAGYKEGDRFFYFPGDGDGKIHLVDSHEPVDEEFLKDYTRDPNNYGYWLYTRNNPAVAQVLVFGDANSVYNSNFNSNKVTVFFAHGWNGNGKGEMNIMLRDAFLQDGDVNVIVFDWSEVAGAGYLTAKAGTAEVGHGLGQFVTWLTTFGLPYQIIHLVGFSLGGHLVGNAGRATNGAVGRITALDPAAPFWENDNNKINASNGVYVEVIHTNTAFLGYRDLCGDADFYPNGGASMTGCWDSSCSHSMAYKYMASSVKYNHFVANECATLDEAVRDRCSGSQYPMGNSDLNKSRHGIFRVNTQTNYPY